MKDDVEKRPRLMNIWPPYLPIIVAAIHGAGLPLQVKRANPFQLQVHYSATDAEDFDIKASAVPAIMKERVDQ